MNDDHFTLSDAADPVTQLQEAGGLLMRVVIDKVAKSMLFQEYVNELVTKRVEALRRAPSLERESPFYQNVLSVMTDALGNKDNDMLLNALDTATAEVLSDNTSETRSQLDDALEDALPDAIDDKTKDIVTHLGETDDLDRLIARIVYEKLATSEFRVIVDSSMMESAISISPR